MSKEYPCVYHDHGKCQKFSDDQYNAWCVNGPCEDQVMSYADYMRAMTDEEIAKWIVEFVELLLKSNGMDDRYVLGECLGADILNRIKQPYKEDT